MLGARNEPYIVKFKVVIDFWQFVEHEKFYLVQPFVFYIDWIHVDYGDAFEFF